MNRARADRLRAIAFAAAMIVGRAVFPRLAYRLRWPTRLGRRRLALYIAGNALLLFAIRQFLVPGLRAAGERHERAREELRARLGREPTDVEIVEHLGLS